MSDVGSSKTDFAYRSIAGGQRPTNGKGHWSTKVGKIRSALELFVSFLFIHPANTWALEEVYQPE